MRLDVDASSRANEKSVPEEVLLKICGGYACEISQTFVGQRCAA